MMRKILAAVLSAAFFVGIFAGFTRLTEPKYDGTDSPLEGSFTAEYYNETVGHDVIFIGDCEVYENFDPLYLWGQYGLASYIRGNAQQQVWQSYYMLEDTLRYETPRVVIYNVQELMYDKPQREEYNRMVFDGMRWSKAKWEGIRASMMPEEHMIEYLVPLLRYHSRITDLKKSDITYFFSKKPVSLNGYYMRTDVLPVSESDVASVDWVMEDYPGQLTEAGGGEGSWGSDIEIDDPWLEVDGQEEESPDVGQDSGAEQEHRLGEHALAYLERFCQLCEENGIQLILIKAPSLAPRWYPQQEGQVREFAKKRGIPYINFYEKIGELQIDYETDTYDGGLHMNYSGAKKLSKYLGKLLVEDYNLADHRGEKEYEEDFAEKLKRQQEMIQMQEKR